MRVDEFFAQVGPQLALSRLPPALAALLRRYLAHEKVVPFGERFVVNTHFPPYPGRAFDRLLDALGSTTKRDMVRRQQGSHDDLNNSRVSPDTHLRNDGVRMTGELFSCNLMVGLYPDRTVSLSAQQSVAKDVGATIWLLRSSSTEVSQGVQIRES